MFSFVANLKVGSHPGATQKPAKVERALSMDASAASAASGVSILYVQLLVDIKTQMSLMFLILKST